MPTHRRNLFLGLVVLAIWKGGAFSPLATKRARSTSGSSLLFLASNDESDDDDDYQQDIAMGPAATNVLGTQLCPCCTDVGGTGIGTGFYRNGYCATGEQDIGRHTVCVQVTDDFLEFSKSVGNDLSTPIPQYLFPGLKHGDIWCLCAQRWGQAYEAGKAPRLFLQATHEKTLDYVDFDILRLFALDQQEADKALENLNEQRERLNKLLEKKIE
jgi:hypothetical protein